MKSKHIQFIFSWCYIYSGSLMNMSLSAVSFLVFANLLTFVINLFTHPVFVAYICIVICTWKKYLNLVKVSETSVAAFIFNGVIFFSLQLLIYLIMMLIGLLQVNVQKTKTYHEPQISQCDFSVASWLGAGVCFRM